MQKINNIKISLYQESSKENSINGRIVINNVIFIKKAICAYSLKFNIINIFNSIDRIKIADKIMKSERKIESRRRLSRHLDYLNNKNKIIFNILI